MRLVIVPTVAVTFFLSAAAATAIETSLAMDGERVKSSIRNQNAVVTAKRQDSTANSPEDAQSVSGLSPWEYRFREGSCEGRPGATACLLVACPEAIQTGYLVERRPRDSSEAWDLVGTTCEEVHGPVLTQARILEEVRRVGLPSMSVEAPPESFVNYETVVYTHAETFTRTVNLLGFAVDIEATPSRFHWSYGDAPPRPPRPPAGRTPPPTSPTPGPTPTAPSTPAST